MDMVYEKAKEIVKDDYELFWIGMYTSFLLHSLVEHIKTVEALDKIKGLFGIKEMLESMLRKDKIKN